MFLNTVASTESSPSFYNVGFVYENNGVILNSYSSPSIFDLISSSGDVISGVTNTRIFSLGESVNTSWSRGASETNLINCNAYSTNYVCNQYYNIEYKVYQTYKSNSYLPYKGSTNILFGQTNNSDTNAKGFKLYNENINYGLATPLSYNTVVDEDFTLGSLHTGAGTSLKPYKVNNFKRFKHLSSELNARMIRFVNNINAYELDISGYIVNYLGYYISHNTTTAEIIVDNLQLYALYNLNLKTDKNLFNITNNQTLGTTKLTLKNFGVVANGGGAHTHSTGFLINQVNTLNATNSYVSLKEKVTLGSDNSNIYDDNLQEFYYGVFAGKVSSLTMEGCFVNADIDINSCSLNNKDLSTYVGLLVGDADGSIGTIKNSFATGTITINNQRTEKTKMFVGGLVGNIGKSAFSYCYSNVSLKNRISNKYYKNVFVGAFIGYSQYVGSHYLLYSNYIDQNISLTAKVAGKDSADHNNLCNLTLLTSSVFNGAQYANNDANDDTKDKHLPIQKVFSGDKIVYSTLNISDSSQTGSKMAPIKLVGGSLSNNKYYYLGSSIYTNYNSAYYKNITIIGNGKRIENSQRSNYKYLFNCNGGGGNVENLTISGVVLDSSFVYDIRKSYVYNFKIDDESGSPITLPTNYSYGYGCAPISRSSGTVYDRCSVSGDITPKDKMRNSDYATHISAFIYSSSNDTIKDIDIEEVTIGVYEDLWYTKTSGIVSSISTTYPTALLGNIKVNLKTKVNGKEDYGGYCVGGIAGSITNADMLKIYADIDTTLDVTNNTVEISVGGLIGKIGQYYNNNSIGYDFDTNITNASITINTVGDKEDPYAYISPAVGECIIPSTKTLTGINMNCSPNVKITSNSSYENWFNIGGIVGYLQSGILDLVTCKGDKFVVDKYGSSQSYIRIGGLVGTTINNNATISNCTVNQDINVTDNSSDSFCVVGGVVGYLNGGYVSNSTCKGLVAGLTYATKSINQLNVEDARTFDWDGTDATSNYQLVPMHIPLVVGGIVGYYQNGTLGSVNKERGDVRALIYSSAKLEEKSSIDMVTGNDAGGSASGLKTENQAKNGEKCQARVGAICGIISKSYVTRVNDGSNKHVYKIKMVVL